MPPNDASPSGDKPRPVLLLLEQKQTAGNLIFQLRLKGKNDEAEKLQQKCDELQDQIDELLKKSMQDWLDQAQKLQGDLQDAVKGLKKSVAEIKKNVQTAQNITKAIGFVDDAIRIAGKLTTGV